MSEAPIYHLNKARMSGRFVKLRELGHDEITAARLCAAKEAGKGASAYEIEVRRRDECMRRAVSAVTEAGLEKLDGAKWIDVTQEQLEEPSGKFAFGKLFTAKDAAALNYFVSKQIDVGDDEIEAIELGMLTASGD